MRFDHEVEETDDEPHPGGQLADLMHSHLADALGSLTRYFLEILFGVAANIRGAEFFCAAPTSGERELRVADFAILLIRPCRHRWLTMGLTSTEPKGCRR